MKIKVGFAALFDCKQNDSFPIKICVAKTVTISVFYSCRMPWKMSNVVTAMNGFTERVNESQMLCFAKKLKIRLVVLSVLIKKS